MKTPKPTGIELAVCVDIANRQQLGIKKYGQTVAENRSNHRERLVHAYEEHLDAAIYLKWAIEQLCPKCGGWMKEGICQNHGCE